MEQFTFLISVTWNNLGLPLIQDKLALGSELMVKILVPLIGTSNLYVLVNTTNNLIRILMVIPPLLPRLPRILSSIHT
jgi:hypothetical protein